MIMQHCVLIVVLNSIVFRFTLKKSHFAAPFFVRQRNVHRRGFVIAMIFSEYLHDWQAKQVVSVDVIDGVHLAGLVFVTTSDRWVDNLTTSSLVLQRRALQ